MRGAHMVGLVLMAVLIACVPTHGEEPSILADPMSGSRDPQIAPQPQATSTEMDASMHAQAPDAATQPAMEPLTNDASNPNIPRGGIQNPDRIAEGYGADADEGVTIPPPPPTSHTTPPNVTEYIPWSVFNSTDPAYMRRPILVKPMGDEQNTTHGPAICRPGTYQTQPQSVFNTVPANALGRWYFKVGNTYAWCSATLIQPNVILTALHCVYNCQTKTWLSTGTFYHQFYNGGFKSSANGKAYIGWIDNCDNYDFTVIRLDRSINLPSYPAVTTSTSSAVSASKNGFIYSYPGETNTGRVPLLSAKNPIAQIRYPVPSKFETDLSIEAGSSGSALYLKGLSAAQGGSPLIVGVTSYGYVNNQCPNGFAAFQSSNGYNVKNLLNYLGK